MADQKNDIIALEKRFWQTMVDGNTDAALGLLAEPALMVSQHGAMQFDHVGYRKMADNPDYKLVSYELSNLSVLNPSERRHPHLRVDQTTTRTPPDVGASGWRRCATW
jgi:hypothetical protein